MVINKNINSAYENFCYENKILSNIQINITGKCNARCSFCFQEGANEKELKLSELITLVDDSRELGVYAVSIAGGEPFAHPDIIEFIKYTRKKGMEVTIVTNAHLMDDGDIDFLYEYSVTNVGVSFHSINPEKYSDIFKVDIINYYKALNNIKKMIDKGINVSIACTVSNQNIDEIHQIKAFFMDMGINKGYISFNNLIQGKHNISDIEVNEYDQLTVNPGRIIGDDDSKRICSAGRSSLVVNYDGEVQICSFFDVSLGNIKKQTLKNIWEESGLLKFYQSIMENDFKDCEVCENEKKCKICIARNMIISGDVFKIPKVTCDAAKKFINEKVF